MVPMASLVVAGITHTEAASGALLGLPCGKGGQKDALEDVAGPRGALDASGAGAVHDWRLPAGGAQAAYTWPRMETVSRRPCRASEVSFAAHAGEVRRS